jgi:hypothetical protein
LYFSTDKIFTRLRDYQTVFDLDRYWKQQIQTKIIARFDILNVEVSI